MCPYCYTVLIPSYLVDIARLFLLERDHDSPETVAKIFVALYNNLVLKLTHSTIRAWLSPHELRSHQVAASSELACLQDGCLPPGLPAPGMLEFSSRTLITLGNSQRQNCSKLFISMYRQLFSKTCNFAWGVACHQPNGCVSSRDWCARGSTAHSCALCFASRGAKWTHWISFKLISTGNMPSRSRPVTLQLLMCIQSVGPD